MGFEKPPMLARLEQADLAVEMTLGITLRQILAQRVGRRCMTELLQMGRLAQQQTKRAAESRVSRSVFGNLPEGLEKLFRLIGPVHQ